MKRFFILCSAAMVVLTGHSQIQVDKRIEMTGADGDRIITYLETPVDGTDAANKDYVDTAVSAGGGGGELSMISAESSSAMTLGSAVRYCHDLTESGHTDWRMPRAGELIAVASSGGVSVPSNSSSNWVWYIPETAVYDTYYGGGATTTRWRFSDGSFAYSRDLGNLGATTAYVRCVR